MGEIKDHRRKKGTKANEENRRLREKIKGADSAKGENQTHEVENNMKLGIMDYGGK